MSKPLKPDSESSGPAAPARVRIKVAQRIPFWRRNLLALSVLGVLGLALSVTYLKRHELRWELGKRVAEKHFAEAGEALEAGDAVTARRLAMAASGFLGPELRLKRLLLRALVAESNPGVVVSAISLFNDPDATLQDKAYSLSVMNMAGNVVLLEEFYDRLSDEEREHPDIIYPYANFLFGSGAAEQVIDLVSRQDLQTEDRFRMLLAQAHFQQETPEALVKAQDLLVGLAGSSDASIAKMAFNMLGKLPPEQMTHAVRQALTAALSTEEPQTAFDHLVKYSLQIATGERTAEEVAREAVDIVAPLDKIELCAWLLQRGRNDLVANLISEEEWALSGQLFGSKISALSNLGRHAEALAMMADRHPQMPPARFFAIKALLAGELGEESLRTKSWDLAMQEAEQIFTENQFLVLAQTAKNAGHLRTAVECYFRATQHPIGIPPAFRDLEWVMMALAEQGRAEDLLKMTRTLVSLESNNHVLANNLIYLTLILGDDKAATKALIRAQREVVENHPDDMDFVSTLALALVMAGEYPEAVEIANLIDAERWEADSGSNRAIFAIVRAAIGDLAQADSLLQAVDWASVMSSEESRLKNQYLLLANPPEKEG